MKRRTATITTLLAALLTTPGVLALQLMHPAEMGPKIGEKAPDFELVDAEGRTCRLETYREKLVILEWINPDCPYVERHYRSGSMPETYRQVRQLVPNAVWLAIDSTHDATPASAKLWIEQYKLAYPILLDRTGDVGKRYDARRTPQMFVIDEQGNLRYAGAIDDNHLGTKRRGEAKNYVVDAVRQIVAGEAVTPDRVKPYGCSVKYSR